jgi:AcrR family transcriptional regulator
VRVDAQRNREQVLAAAQQLFADRGTSVPVDEIARAAGVGVGTVHRHFLTKDDLVDAALIASCEPIFGLLETAAADPDAGHALEQLLLELTEHQSRHRGLAERMRETDDLSPAVVEVKQQIAAGLRAVVARAQATGQVRADVVPTDLRLLFAGLATAATATGQSCSPEERLRFVRILLDGLRTPDPSPLPPLPAPPTAPAPNS